jgi:hypothetical protein
MSQRIEQAHWNVHWRLGESAGIQIYLAEYRGQRVLWEGSLPYVTIDHQSSSLAPEEQADDGHGPFWIPLGLRTLVGSVRHTSCRGGFELAADFLAGPYRYTQLWRFTDGGRISPWLTIHGPGLHEGHTYHPHWRFDFDLGDGQGDQVEQFQDGGWAPIAREGWFPHTGHADPQGIAWRQSSRRARTSVGIKPHRWDDAELFAVRYREGEGPPFTPRAEAGSQPFPAAHVGNESLDGQDATLWYVAHVHYDAAFPFTAGPQIQVQAS